MTRFTVALAAVASTALVARAAAAQAPPLALDRFQPAPVGDTFAAVESPEAGRRVAVGAVFSYAHAPLTHRLADATGEHTERIVSEQTIAHLGGALELAGRLKLDVDVPFVLAQGGTATTAAGRPFAEPSGGRIADLRLGARLVAVNPQGAVPGAALGVRVFLPTGKAEQYTGAGEVRYAPSLTLGAHHDPIRWAVSVWRTWHGGSATAAGLAGSDVGVSAAVAVVAGPVQIGPEAYMTTVADGVTAAFGRTTTNTELLLAGRWAFGDFAATLAGGPGLGAGVGTPVYRLLAGFAYAPVEREVPLAPPPPAQPTAHGEPPASISDAAAVGAARASAAPSVVLVVPPLEAPVTKGPETARIEGQQIVITRQIVFDTGKDTLQAQSVPVLDEVAAILKAHPEIARLAVDGHTDDQGVPAKNVALSQRRAVAVVRWLVDHGVDARRVESRAFGPRRPIADNKTDAGRAQNRRVEFQIRKRTAEGEAGWTDGPVE